MPSYHGLLAPAETAAHRRVHPVAARRAPAGPDRAASAAPTRCPTEASPTAERHPARERDRDAARAEPDYLHAGRGIRSWLLTTRPQAHRAHVLRRGRSSCSCLGGVFALRPAHRAAHARAAPSWTPTTYNRMFTLHGVVMVWLFMIPSIPTVFGNFVLPIMLGAKDLAFPRLNLASFYVYVARRRRSSLGGMVAGGADTGWTFYAPYSDHARRPRVVPVVARRLRPRRLVDHDRPQLHRHHPHAARARA